MASGDWLLVAIWATASMVAVAAVTMNPSGGRDAALIAFAGPVVVLWLVVGLAIRSGHFSPRFLRGPRLLVHVPVGFAAIAGWALLFMYLSPPDLARIEAFQTTANAIWFLAVMQLVELLGRAVVSSERELTT